VHADPVDSPSFSDDELYDRMAANLLASWERYAEGSPGASLEHVPGAAVALFPAEPERAIYNNTLLARRLDEPQVRQAVDATAEAYAGTGVDRYTVWAHETEDAAIAELANRGFRVDTWTRAMAMPLHDIPIEPPEIELRTGHWREHLRYLEAVGVPPGLLAGVDGHAFHVLVALMEGRVVATAIACDHDGDCGIYNMGTLPHARRRGLGTALTSLHLHGAHERGCATASLQATEMAERIYASVGFRDLGRFIEYVPGTQSPGARRRPARPRPREPGTRSHSRTRRRRWGC
jgi:ribosomal protein S18 acetylase RimI-like enzyme